jgi:xylulokinase
MIEDATGMRVKEFVAIGGGAASDLWCQIMADATARTVRRSRTVEASSLGAAICAAAGAGWYSNAVEAAEAMSDNILRDTQPSREGCARYTELFGIYRELYPTLRETFSKLSQFRLEKSRETRG